MSLALQVAALENELARTKHERYEARALIFRMLKQYGGQIGGATLNPLTDEEIELCKNGTLFLDENFVIKFLKL